MADTVEEVYVWSGTEWVPVVRDDCELPISSADDTVTLDGAANTFTVSTGGEERVVVDAAGNKLSKQSFAQAIDPAQASMLLTRCLAFLGQEPSSTLADANPQEILSWAVNHWDMQRVPKLATLPNA